MGTSILFVIVLALTIAVDCDCRIFFKDFVVLKSRISFPPLEIFPGYIFKQQCFCHLLLVIFVNILLCH